MSVELLMQCAPSGAGYTVRDIRRRVPNRLNNRAPLSDCEANRFTGLERDAMRDNAGIIEFGHHPIGNVACTLARSTRQEHNVRDLKRMSKPFT